MEMATCTRSDALTIFKTSPTQLLQVAARERQLNSNVQHWRALCVLLCLDTFIAGTALVQEVLRLYCLMVFIPQ